MGTKRAAETKVMNGFQHAGLAAAVAPDQDIEAGRQRETGVLNVAKVAELEFDQWTRLDPHRHHHVLGILVLKILNNGAADGIAQADPDLVTF